MLRGYLPSILSFVCMICVVVYTIQKGSLRIVREYTGVNFEFEAAQEHANRIQDCRSY